MDTSELYKYVVNPKIGSFKKFPDFINYFK